MKNEVLADRVKYFKKSDKGADNMCQIMEEIFAMGAEQGEARGEARGIAMGIKQGEARGEERGDKKGQKKIIMQLLKNMSIREVADNLNMTIEEVEKIISSGD